MKLQGMWRLLPVVLVLAGCGQKPQPSPSKEEKALAEIENVGGHYYHDEIGLVVNLEGSKVTDADLIHLKGLAELAKLHLGESQVSVRWPRFHGHFNCLVSRLR